MNPDEVRVIEAMFADDRHEVGEAINALTAEVRQLYADNVLLLGEADRLQAQLSQLLTVARSLRDQSNEAGITCLFCGCMYDDFTDPDQHAGGCPCVVLNVAIAKADGAEA